MTVIDYEEEQAMEVEALESIYMDEFKKLQDQPLQYEIALMPYSDGGEEDEINYVAIRLQCIIPSTYPDVAPELEIVLDKGLSDEQKKEMMALLDQQVEENTGIAIIFTLCEALKEYLMENNREGNDDSEYQQMLRRGEKQAKVEEIQLLKDEKEHLKNMNSHETQKVEGTPVTADTFREWKMTFDSENLNLHGSVRITQIHQKLTGKQVWLQGLVKDTREEEQGDVEDDEEDDEYAEGCDEEERADEEENCDAERQ